MPQVNTITCCEATLASGEKVEYSDWEPQHSREGRFARILAGLPMEFTAVTTDGSRFSVNLVSGELAAGIDKFTPDLPHGTGLRLVYYKRMSTGIGDPLPTCDFFVVGWQATVSGRNVKVGLKVFPAEFRWEVTEDI